MAVYSPADIAKLLNVKETTLRKYSLLLEDAGYTFQRNAQGQRWYEDKDVIAFQKFVTFKNNGDMNLKQCADAVFLWSRDNDITRPDTTDVTLQTDTERNNAVMTVELQEDFKALKELIGEQNNLIMQLTRNLEEERQKQNQKDAAMFREIQNVKEVLQAQQETQQLLLATTEEEKDEKNKSLWDRLFKK